MEKKSEIGKITADIRNQAHEKKNIEEISKNGNYQAESRKKIELFI